MTKCPHVIVNCGLTEVDLDVITGQDVETNVAYILVNLLLLIQFSRKSLTAETAETEAAATENDDSIKPRSHRAR